MNPTLPENISDRSGAGLHLTTLTLLVAAGVVAAATGALWARYGIQVFYETIVAGIDACF